MNVSQDDWSLLTCIPIRIPFMRNRPDALPFLSPRRQREDAERRRAALNAAGCTTYLLRKNTDHLPILLVERGEYEASILCLCCGGESYHPDHVAQRFCPYCDEFHRDWMQAARPAPACA